MDDLSDELRARLISELAKEARWTGSGKAENEAAALHDYLQKDLSKMGGNEVWVLHRGIQ